MSQIEPPDWQGGWWRFAQPIPSPNFDARPLACVVDLVVIHSISLPPGEYGGPHIRAFFQNQLNPADHPYFEAIADVRVSSHFVIQRSGNCEQYVSIFERAWHAGVSQWGGRERCNDFSVGIELEGLEHYAFDEAQYVSLSRLLHALCQVLPIASVAGHEHIAPGRKQDPGNAFDWRRLQLDVASLDLQMP